MGAPNFFVFGSARSGTTLLAALLSQHPDIFVLNDSWMYRKFNDVLTPRLEEMSRKALSKVLPHPKTIAYAQADRLPAPGSSVSEASLSRLIAELRARHLQEGRKRYVDRLHDGIVNDVCTTPPLTVETMFEFLYQRLLPPSALGKRSYGEKTPSHLYISPGLRRLYPEVKIITLIRNPISNIAGLYKLAHVDSLRTATAMYLSTKDARFRFLYDPAETLLLRYEDLVSSPNKVLEQAQQYLELPVHRTDANFDYYTRQSYIGGHIDEQRDMRTRSILTEKQKSRIRRQCLAVYEQFYPEQL